MTVTSMTVSAVSLEIFLLALRTAVTTAVDDPDITAPRKMDSTMFQPSRDPAMYPHRTIRGSCTAATIIVKAPLCFSFLMLSSMPMANMSSTRPMLDRRSMTVLLSPSGMPQKFAMNMPAARYPMMAGILSLLNRIDATLASTSINAIIVRKATSSILFPCTRISV